MKKAGHIKLSLTLNILQKMLVKTFLQVFPVFFLLSTPTQILAVLPNQTKENPFCISIQKEIKESTLLHEKGEHEQAMSKLYEIIRKGDQDACPELLITAHRLQAEIFSIQHDYNSSVSSYLTAIAIAEKLKSEQLLSELYISIGNLFFQMRAYEKAAEYYEKALAIPLAIEQKDQELFLLENIALAYLGYNQNDKALSSLKYIIPKTSEDGYENLRTRTLYRISEIYQKQAQWELAIEYSNHLYEEQKSKDNFLGAVLALNNKAYNEIRNKDLLAAEQTLQEAIKEAMTHTIPSSTMAGIYTNLGVCYQNQGKYTQSINSLNNAVQFAKNEAGSTQLADIYNTAAWVYYRNGDLYNASRYSRLAIEEAQKANDPITLSNSYYSYSQFLREGNDHVAALDYYEKYSSLRDSLELEKRVQLEKDEQLTGQIERTEREQRLYLADKEMQGLILKQLRLESESRRQEIELLKKERELEQSEKDRAYQTLLLSKKEQEATLQQATIRNLEQENSIKALQLKQKESEELQQKQEIALLQSEKLRQNLEIEKEKETRKRAVWMLALSALVLIIVVASLVTTRKKNLLLAKQKEEIEEQNFTLEKANTEIIEMNIQLNEQAEEIISQNEEITAQRDILQEQNRDITASIRYARLIQNAVLPNMEELQNLFPKHFILYKPRDIVSGDFWWLHSFNDRKTLAVADCTGHGVPGAFLSMLGIALLSEIVSLHPEIQTDSLLDNLQIKMEEAMMQGKDTNPQRDGMDIAVCTINSKTLEIEFSGANNPLYILRNGEIEIIKGDKKPIGRGSHNEMLFTQKKWQAQPKDRIFLFSDGFADQFGGKSGKKLMYKPFRELLINSASLPMHQVRGYLDKAFTEWKGEYKQIDDVLVMGFEV